VPGSENPRNRSVGSAETRKRDHGTTTSRLRGLAVVGVEAAWNIRVRCPRLTRLRDLSRQGVDEWPANPHLWFHNCVSNTAPLPKTRTRFAKRRCGSTQSPSPLTPAINAPSAQAISRPGRKQAGPSLGPPRRFEHDAPRCVRSRPPDFAGQREEAPRGGLVGETVASGCSQTPVTAKWPFEGFLNRESLPLTWISRWMAAESVACGVLPPGLVQ
jgi:hypothetical protein